MNLYKKEDWGMRMDDTMFGGFDERTYVDEKDNLLTGVLEGFYGFKTDDPMKNRQYVENGKVADTDFNYKG